MGEFTDQPEKKDDHTIDAACYSADSGSRWVDLDEIGRTGDLNRIYDHIHSVDPVTGYARV